jgi:hypothetical protein
VRIRNSGKGLDCSNCVDVRLNSPLQRDAYAEVLNAHYEVLKRGEYPGTGHLQKRQNPSGILASTPPEVVPAVVLDEDGQDVSKCVI